MLQKVAAAPKAAPLAAKTVPKKDESSDDSSDSDSDEDDVSFSSPGSISSQFTSPTLLANHGLR